MNTNSKSVSNNDLSSSLSKLMSDKTSSNRNSGNSIFSDNDKTSDLMNPSSDATDGSSISNYFANITWQTWLIVVLILALLGINIFAYLAKATTDFSGIFDTYFRPIVSFFGFGVLETTKQTISTSATGTKAGVDVVANTSTGTIDAIEGAVKGSNTNASKLSTSNPSAQKASSAQKNSMPVQQQIQEAGGMYEWNQNALDSALNDASKIKEPQPDDSLSSVQGKAGWCYIGVDRETRACSQIGVNDQCMSGDIFPSQEICMNPNLRP